MGSSAGGRRDADGKEGDARGYKVKAAVQGLGKDTEAVGGEPGSEFDERQEQRPEQRREGRVLFFRNALLVVRGFGSHENTGEMAAPLRPFAERALGRQLSTPCS